MIRKFLRQAMIWVWVLNSHIGRRASIGCDKQAVVIIPSYSPARVKHVQTQVRSILKCDFVEKIIVSNHNPKVRIEDWVKIRNERLILINQPVRRGCGYGWAVAARENPDYLLSIDDDVLIFPGQLAQLFSGLLQRPEVPHGLAGGIGHQYCERSEMRVDNLYQIYAVTDLQLARYLEISEQIISQGKASREDVEFWADDLIISRTGGDRPLIHDAGLILRDSTANDVDESTWKQDEFTHRRSIVAQALQDKE